MMIYQAEHTKQEGAKQLITDPKIIRFLEKHNLLPELDKDQLLWLQEAIQDVKDEDQKRAIIEAVLYVILAHDTHETIDEPNAEFPLQEEERELVVLAGDYFSALYYRTLASQGKIDLIQAIQKGVEETNAAKTNIYQLHVATDEEFLEELIKSNAAITLRFAEYFGNEEAFLHIAKQTLLLKRLLLERQLYETTNTSRLIGAYDHGYFAKTGQATFAIWLGEIINAVKAEVSGSLTSNALSAKLVIRIKELLAA